MHLFNELSVNEPGILMLGNNFVHKIILFAQGVANLNKMPYPAHGILALTRRFLTNSIRISKGYSRRHTHSSDMIIPGSTAITHQDGYRYAFIQKAASGRKKMNDRADGVVGIHCEKRNIQASWNHHFPCAVLESV